MHISDQKSALVIGAGIGGLLTARVLADHFDDVTILERDSVPADGQSRKGVPQGRHGHGVLARGYQIMKQLLPGLDQDLIEAGGIEGDIVNDVIWFQGGSYKAQFDSGLEGIVVSRPTLETTIRRRLLDLPNVTIRDNIRVRGLIATPDRKRVVGLTVDAPEGPVVLRSGLVVDAGGRGSQTPAWLQQIGYERPEESTITVNARYATRLFRRLPGELGGNNAAIVAGRAPAEPYGGFTIAMEGDRWIVSLVGLHGHHPPSDGPGFAEFARRLPAPEIYKIVSEAEPLSDIVTHRFPHNLRRHYERLDRVPDGLLVTGDALSSFNPIYGQGMTVAAMEAEALADGLMSGIDGLSERFFPAAAKVIDIPWGLAAGSDFAFPGVQGRKPLGNSIVNRYIDRIHRVAQTDHTVCLAFMEVANLVAPPTTLFRPGFVARVLRPGAPTSPKETRPVSAAIGRGSGGPGS